MVLSRFKPRTRQLRPMNEWQDFMNEFFGTPMMWRRTPGENMAWAPTADIYEQEDSYIIRAELPGVKKEDIEVSVTGDTLTIKGERNPAEDIGEEQYQCSEICYGSFSRLITLPSAIDADKVEATYENGVMEIRVPKAKEAMPTKVEIKAGQMQSGQDANRH